MIRESVTASLLSRAAAAADEVSRYLNEALGIYYLESAVRRALHWTASRIAGTVDRSLRSSAAARASLNVLTGLKVRIEGWCANLYGGSELLEILEAAVRNYRWVE